MNLRDLNIKPVYNSNDDILEFYNKTLSLAQSYKRASGFFTHGLLKYISKGILGLAKNNGKFQLVISNKVNPETYEKIQKGYHNIIDKINLIELEENISDLAFLISIGLVDIKIAFSKGLFHEKYGLINDYDNNIILFSGSNNETEAAISSNFESFETTINWNCSERDIKKIEYRLSQFDKLWNNETDNLYVCDAPDALYNRILKKLDTKKSIDFIEKDILYIDLKNQKLECHFNYDYNFDKWYKFHTWSSLILKKTVKKIIFKPTLSAIDIENIITSLKRKMNTEDVGFLLSKRTQAFYENKILNLEESSNRGSVIKDTNFINSNDFLAFERLLNYKLKRSLRKMQSLGAYHIVKLKRVFNFSVPGSGKTATVLGAYKYLEDKGKVKKLFVLGPKNSFKSWRDEIKAVLNYEDIIDLSISSNFDDKRLELKYDYDKSRIIFLNFEGTLNASDIIKNYINEEVMVIFDEIHRIKGIESEMYKATHKIVHDAVYKVALTGTPLPNGYIDLYNQFELLFGDYSKSYFGFSIDHLKSNDLTFKKQNILSHNIKEKIYPFYIRLNKRDLKVPAPNPDVLIPVDECKMLVDMYNEIEESKDLVSLDKIIKLVRLSVTPPVENNDDFYTEKVKKCVDLVNKIIARNESVIIWTNYIDSLRKIYKLLNKTYSNIEYIYGDTDIKKRNSIIDNFNSGNVKILITNPQTLAESVSLHKVCNNAIYMEIDYNLTHFLQSRDRIHRLGIENSRQTNYYILQSYFDGKSIDKVIYDILSRKKLRMKDSIDSSLMMEKLNNEIIKELNASEK